MAQSLGRALQPPIGYRDQSLMMGWNLLTAATPARMLGRKTL
jgi:hypothetical protein